MEMSSLTNYELMEIEQYKDKGIFYTGELAKKIEPTSSSARNFEDRRGYYRITPGDHLRYRYQILNELGAGSFGSVAKALDHKKDRYVAIKILRRRRDSSRNDEEERIMKQLNETLKHEDHIVYLRKSFSFRDHKCLVMEYLDQDLKEHLIYKGRCSVDLARVICHDILKALRFLHDRQIIHADVKPSNIVFKNAVTSRVKLVDFGCSHVESTEWASYMQTRSYRAPEVVLRLLYTRAIDMWGLATTVYEAFAGLPLFRTFNEEDLVVQMVEVMGEPATNLLSVWQQFSGKASTYFRSTGQLRRSSSAITQKGLGKNGGEPLSRSIEKRFGENANHLFVDFLQNCLSWDAGHRMTASEGLLHEWIKERPQRHITPITTEDC